MWTDYTLRAESQEAFDAAAPVYWKNVSGEVVGNDDAAVDVIGNRNGWYLVNVRTRAPLPDGLTPFVITAPSHPVRAWA